MLTVTFVFETLDTPDACYWRSVNLGEASIANFEAFARSTCQRVFELLAFKARKEAVTGKMSAKELAANWRANVVQSGSRFSEPVTDSFVDTAFKVHERLLGVPNLRMIVLQVDEAYGKGSPFNSLSVLEKFAIKCKTPDMLEWALACLADQLASGAASPGDFSVRALVGKGTGGGNRGVLDLFIAKKDCLDYITGTFLSEHPFGVAFTVLARSFKTHGDFRAKCGSCGDNTDLSWMGTLQDSGRTVIDILKDTC